jgi:uncharacterized protein
MEELKKPNRDPRDHYPKPIMQKGIIAFEDLHEGMKLTGKIKNVVDFGAFVDLGIKETALVHISELSDNFVKDPMSIIKVGDVLEFRIIGLDQDRRRISLSRKSGEAKALEAKAGVGASPIRSTSADNRKQTPRPHQNQKPGDARPTKADDDGTMYNPFADAFKKMRGT